MIFPTLETERLILRPLQEADFDNMFCLETNQTVLLTMENHVPNDPIKYRNNFMKAVNGGEYFVIQCKKTSSFIGFIAIHQYIKKNKINYSQIWTALMPKFWGRRYCTEALNKILHFAFVAIKTPWICANQFHSNPAAAKVLTNCGLTYYKTYKMNNQLYDQYRYTINDYYKKNQHASNDKYDYEFIIKTSPSQPSPYSFGNPIRKIDGIRYIKQPTDYLCGQAVIAMLADVAVDEVIEVMQNDKGTSTPMIREALNYYGIKTATKARTKYFRDAVLPECAILSIQLPGYGHWSLFYKNKYYDPEFGVLENLPENAKLRYYWEIVL